MSGFFSALVPLLATVGALVILAAAGYGVYSFLQRRKMAAQQHAAGPAASLAGPALSPAPAALAPAKPTQVPIPVQAVSLAPEEDLLERDLPVILAAVAAVMGRRHRVLSVLTPSHLAGTAWGAVTRFEHMGGQRIVWDRVTLAPGPKKSRFRFWS